MNKTVTRVSGLAIAFSLFQVGSTTLFLLGGKAKQDAWLAMLIGALAGFILLTMYLSMHKLDPHRDLYELLCHYWGKWVGSLGGFCSSVTLLTKLPGVSGTLVSLAH